MSRHSLVSQINRVQDGKLNLQWNRIHPVISLPTKIMSAIFFPHQHDETGSRKDPPVYVYIEEGIGHLAAADRKKREREEEEENKMECCFFYFPC